MTLLSLYDLNQDVTGMLLFLRSLVFENSGNNFKTAISVFKPFLNFSKKASNFSEKVTLSSVTEK